MSNNQRLGLHRALGTGNAGAAVVLSDAAAAVAAHGEV